MVGRLDRGHDYLADMLAAMLGDPETLTVAFNIAMRGAFAAMPAFIMNRNHGFPEVSESQRSGAPVPAMPR